MRRAVSTGRVPAAAVSVFTIVAAWSVGFAVGDALATPHPTAATIEHTEQWSELRASGEADRLDPAGL